MMDTFAERTSELLEELSFFEDWTDRYEYVIGLGKKMEILPEDQCTDETLIKGCQSHVWLDSYTEGDKVYYLADSDSLITKGMIAMFIRVLSGLSADEVLTADFGFIDKTGLKEHLAPSRANALSLMATQMKQRALNSSK